MTQEQVRKTKNLLSRSLTTLGGSSLNFKNICWLVRILYFPLKLQLKASVLKRGSRVNQSQVYLLNLQVKYKEVKARNAQLLKMLQQGESESTI